MKAVGIDVVVIGPGGVATPIWDKAEAQDDSAYGHTEYASALKGFQNYIIQQGRTSYTPEQIGEAVWHALTVPRPHVRYAVVPQRLANWVQSTLLPKRLIDRNIARNLGFSKA